MDIFKDPLLVWLVIGVFIGIKGPFSCQGWEVGSEELGEKWGVVGWPLPLGLMLDMEVEFELHGGWGEGHFEGVHGLVLCGLAFFFCFYLVHCFDEVGGSLPLLGEVSRADGHDVVSESEWDNVLGPKVRMDGFLLDAIDGCQLGGNSASMG